MKKYSSKMVILGSLLVIFSLVLMFQPLFTWAQIVTDSHPCRVALDPAENLFELENMNPGDIYSRTVEVTKTGSSSASLYLTWDFISGTPGLGELGSLFEQLILVISYQGNELYRGPMVGGPRAGDPSSMSDALYIAFMNYGDVLLLDFKVILPGPETENEFQGSTLVTKLVFYTICADEPDTPSIHIEKATNGLDADLPTGPFIPVGNAVNWTYVVTNPGDVPLSNVVVTDNRAGVNPVYVSGDNNADAILQVGETWLYRANGTAQAGQYANVGTVVGTSPMQEIVTDSDPSHYYGTFSDTPIINIEKATNGVDADLPTGPSVLVGNTVTWTYAVTNPGNVPLRNIAVTDNRVGVNPVYLSGDTNGDSILQVGEVWLFRATGVAVAGQYSNIGTVVGTPPTGYYVTDSDPSHYYGITLDETVINIEKSTNGVDADLPTGPQIAVGGNVNWTYVVTNPNTIPLYNIVVTDNRTGVSPVYISGDLNGDNVLQPGEAWNYRATGIAVSGQYSNIGFVTGASASGKVVTDSDPSHYYNVAIPPEEEVVEPEEPEVEPEEVIIPPEGPKTEPPLPRTDGFSIALFLIGSLLLLSGLLLKRSLTKNQHEHTY